ncbi:hypothetical protein EX30DRAFT_371902 [Ascodesmis nigricans]|uniref:Rhodopsin domain-containing protein n=1 Tax=Ascodesmis nigricans TaxID=341454 RepID=A0A4V3SIP5_9PEZI|nr:hypothetical protein EX30DRAFT_371902 [Ascodesmis nigricans]
MKVGLTNSKLTDEERYLASLNPAELRQRTTGSKIYMAGWSTYTAVVWTLKFCMIIFFGRVMKSLQRQKLIKWVFILTFLGVVGVYGTFFLICIPSKKLWQTYPNPGKNCEVETPIFNIVTLVLNVSTDLFIMLIPLPILWSSRLDMRRKAILLLLFGGGFFVIIAACLRCIFGITQSYSTATAQWACRETFVAIVVGNAPMIKSLFSRSTWKIESSNGQSGESSGIKMYSGSKMSKKSKNRTMTDTELFRTNFESDSTEKMVDGNALQIVANREFTMTTERVHDVERDAGSKGSESTVQVGGSTSGGGGASVGGAGVGTYDPRTGQYSVTIQSGTKGGSSYGNF